MLTRWRGSADGAVIALPGVWISRRLTSLAELLFSLEQKYSVVAYAGNAAQDRAELTFCFVLIKQNIWTSKKLNMGLISQQSGEKCLKIYSKRG